MVMDSPSAPTVVLRHQATAMAAVVDAGGSLLLDVSTLSSDVLVELKKEETEAILPETPVPVRAVVVAVDCCAILVPLCRQVF